MDPSTYGRYLLSKLFERDPDIGGKLALLYGEPGSGKSTLLAQFALKALKMKDIVVWRGRSRDIWPRFPKVVIHKHKDLTIRVVRFRPGSEEVEAVNVPIKEFSSMKELLSNLKKGVINIIYAPKYSKTPRISYLAQNIDPDGQYPEPYWWYEFLLTLTNTPSPRWYFVGIDEFQEIAPANAPKELWKISAVGQNVLNDVRGSWINFFGATHQHYMVDFRIVGKMQWDIYLKGARTHRYSKLHKTRKVIYFPPGTYNAVLESRGAGAWGIISFSSLPKDGYYYHIIEEWKGPIPQQDGSHSVIEYLQKIALEQGINAAFEELDRAVSEGKISPASRYVYRRLLRKTVASLETLLPNSPGVGEL